MLTRLLKLKYASTIFVLLFVLVNFFVFLFLYQQNEHRKNFIRVIDIAGKQRFYSQYIMQNAYTYSFELDDESRFEILETSESMRSDLEYLYNNFYIDLKKYDPLFLKTNLFLDIAQAFVKTSDYDNFLKLKASSDELLPLLLNGVSSLKADFLQKQERVDFYLTIVVLFIIVFSIVFTKYLFMPTIKMLEASYEAQIIVNSDNYILDFNTVAQSMFSNITKGITFNELLILETQGDLDEDIVFESNRTYTFKLKGRYYKLLNKKINNYLSVIDVFDVSELVKESIRKDTIYNSQNSIVVVTDGENIKDINQTFFDTFEYKNLADFKAKHDCICDLFRYKNGYDYVQKKMKELAWNEFIGKNPDTVKNFL